MALCAQIITSFVSYRGASAVSRRVHISSDAGVSSTANFMACWCDAAASEDECLSGSFGGGGNTQPPSF